LNFSTTSPNEGWIFAPTLAIVRGPLAFSSVSKAVHDGLFRLEGFDRSTLMYKLLEVTG
jgi:hypothetical protein